MATLRDMGLEPRTFDSAPVLRDAGLVPRAAPDVTELVDQASANSMGQLRRGFSTGLLNADANAMAADESSLRAQGRSEEADGLRSRIGALQQRALTFAPKEQDVTQLNWEPGRVLDYGLGAVGQGAASMLEPAGAAVGLAAAGRVLGAIPTAPTRLLGGALRLGAPAAAGYLNFRQGKGEFYNDAAEDPTIMAGKTAEEINQSANLSGALSGVIDTAFPAVAAERIAGRAGMKALAKAGMPAKIGLDLAGEGATEVGQGEIKRHLLTDANPLRDTSGDTADRWNDFVGGILGAGPLSAASHLASKGHARLGVADDPNNDVSGKDTTDKAEPKAGDSFSDVLRRGTSERKARAGSDAEVKAWKDTLEGLGSEDPLEGATLQHAALVKELSGRVAKGETGAQEHLDAVSAENPSDPLQMAEPAARDAAAKYLIGDGSDEEAIKKVMKAYEGRKLNTQVDYGDLGGRTGAGEPIAQNDPARAESITRYREMGQRARLTADVLTKALPEAKRKYAKVAASLGQELAHFSGEGYEKPSAGDTARVLRMGAQLVHLYGGEKAHALVTEAGRTANIEGTKLFKALNASVSVAREDVGAYQKAAATSREAAADQLVRVLPPDAELRLRKDGHDLTDPGTREHLLGMVEDVFDGTGMSEMALREAIGDKAFKAVREVVGQPIEPRKKIDKQTEETVDATDTPETKTPTESDESTGDAGLEDGDTWAQEGARKSMDRAPGARQYFFHGRDVPADGATVRNPFVASGKNGLPTLATLDRTDHDGVNSLQRMEEKARELLGFDPNAVKTVTRRGKGMRDGRKTGVVQNKAVDTGRDARHEVNVVSAKSVMDYAGMQDSKRAEVFNNYLEKDGHKPGALAAIQALDQQIADLTAKTPKIKISAGKKTRNPEYVKLEAMRAERWGLMKDLAAAADVRKNAVTGKDELGRDTKERDTVADTLSQDSTAADLVNAYFNDRHLVVADEVGTKDHLRMVLGKLREMTLRGERDIAFAAKVARENGRTPAEREALRKSVEADMNLIQFKTSFTKGEADVAVRASAIVAWVRENKIEYDKPDRKTADSEALDFRNALMSGISAMLADGFMESTPYMKDADGKVQKFGEGERKFPDTLKLGTLTQAALVIRAKNARDKIIAADAAMTPKQRHKKRESTRRAAATKVAAEQGVEEEVDHDKGVPDEFRHPGKERGADDALATDKRDARERFWDAPEQEDNRQERDRVPSEAEPEQKPGAMPTDYTDTTMRSSVMNTERDVPTLTAENAMAKAKGYAEMLLGELRKDAKAGVERIKRVARMMDAPRWVPSGSDKAVGGKFYAAPLAHLLTPTLVKAHPELSAVRSHVADVLTKTDQGALTGAQKIVLAKKLNGETALDAAEAAERKKAAEIGQPPLPIDPRDYLLGEKRIAGINAAEAFLEGLSWAHRKAGKAERKKAGTQRMTVKAEPVAKVAPKVESAAVPGVTVVEHPSPNYGPRTKHNADSAGLTVAIASDFSTAGEKLTARVSEGKYLGIPLDVEPAKAGVRLAKAMRSLGTTTLNVAGNGIYTLAKSGMTQQKINQHVYDTLAAAHALLPITKIVTGGQTGVDIAGAIAAKALGIPTVVTMPGGFKQRGVDQKDTTSTAAGITQQILDGAAVLMVEQEVDKRAAADPADKASAWAAKQLVGDASTIAARNALLKRLGERMAGMTNAQVDALYDAVSNDDVPEGVHKAVWSRAAELARVESDKRDAAARKAEIDGPAESDVSAQAHALLAEKERLMSPGAFDDQEHDSYHSGIDAYLLDAEEIAGANAMNRKTGMPNAKVHAAFMALVEKNRPQLKAFAQAVWDRTAAQHSHNPKVDAFFKENREALANHPDAMENFVASVKHLAKLRKSTTVWGIHADLMQQMFRRQGDEAWRLAQIADKQKRLARYEQENKNVFPRPPFLDVIKKEITLLKANDLQGMVDSAEAWMQKEAPGSVAFPPPANLAPATATRKLNTQLNPVAHLSATVQAVAQTRSLMRLLGFKSAPAQFASVAEKLLTDPTQNPDAFIKESAQALSHLLVRTDAVKAAMKGVAWAQERARLVAKLTGQGMGRIAAQEAAFQTLVGEVLAEELKARTAAERASAGTIFGAAKNFVSAFKRMTATNEFTEVVRTELNKLIEKAHNPERLKEGFAKVTFQAAVDADPQAAAVLAHMAANPKAVLTGSIVLAHGGSVYRNAANMLHDLDFVFNGTHDEAAAHLAKAFPGSIVVNGFQGKSYKVDTHIVPPPGAKLTSVSYKAGKATYTVERDGQVVGRSWHDAAGEHKEGVTGTIVDFFTGEDRPAAQTIPFTTNGQSHSVKAVSAASIFEAKFQMGREKDMLDYVRYVPEAGRKLNTQATPAGVQSSGAAFSPQKYIDEARAYVDKVLGPRIHAEFLKEFKFNGEFVEKENVIKLALHNGPAMLTIAHHEAMHALWSQLVKNSPDAASKLAHVLSSPDIRARLEDLLHNEPTALAQLSDPEERVAYAYQFWAAGLLDVDKPATTLFAKFRKFLRKVFGMVRDSETALDIMTAFHDGKLAEPSAAGRVIEGIMAREKWNEDVRRKFDATIQHVYSSVNVSNKVLRSSESADARSLGEELFSNPGEERDGQNFEGYLNARTRVVRQYTNFLYKGVKGLSQRDLEATAKHMQLKTPLEGIHYAPVREAVKGMRALTKRYYTYATKDAGLQLEYLGDDHYPRVWDLSELVNNREKFVAMLLQPKYAKTMRSALDMVNANKNAPQKTMEDLAAMMHEELMQKNGVDEKGMETERGGNEVLSPFFASQKERSFKWLDDEDVEPFLEKDLIGAMSRYLHQGIRAAEYSRRFGNGGAALRERLAMIGDEWVNPETGRLENRTKPGRIQGELIAAAEERGITGVEADKWVARRMEDIKNSVTAHEGSLGSEISPAVRKITSAAMAYQNLRLLPLSLFAAFADPLSIAARGPGVKAGFEAFTNGLRDVWLRWKDAASDMPAERRRSMWDDMAETAGVVDSHMFLEQMGKAHTSEFMTDFARKANRALFMANGLTAWDRSMRVTATKFAALFLQDHKSLPDKHSARWLAELGLKPEDIPLDADGKLIYDRHTLAASRYSADMNADEKAAVLAQATQEIEKVHYALTRWVEGAVLTPNAAQRPTWGSDPRWAVLFHLKQFTYSFQDTVIKRAFNEASHGNMNPIGALAASVPTMMVSDILKGFVMGGGSMPAYMKTWGLGDHMMHAVSRAGLAGTSQFGLDALRDPASLFGPTVEQAIKVVANPSEIGKNIVDAIPGVRFLGPAKDLGRAMSD